MKSIQKAIERINKRLDLIEQRLDKPTPQPDLSKEQTATLAEIKSLKANGYYLQAIKEYRETYHCSLVEAKKAVDNLT